MNVQSICEASEKSVMLSLFKLFVNKIYILICIILFIIYSIYFIYYSIFYHIKDIYNDSAFKENKIKVVIAFIISHFFFSSAVFS